MDINWAALEIEYVNSSITYKKLSEKHGAPFHTVRKYGEIHKWGDRRRTLSQSIASEAIVRIAEQRVDELAEFNKDDLKVAKAIRGQVAKQIARGQQLGEMSPADLRALSSAAEAAQRIGRLALGATTENVPSVGYPLVLSQADAKL